MHSLSAIFWVEKKTYSTQKSWAMGNKHETSTRPPNQSLASFDRDLLTPKLTISCPCPKDHFCQLASKSINSFSTYRVHKSGNRRTNERTRWEYYASACHSGVHGRKIKTGKHTVHSISTTKLSWENILIACHTIYLGTASAEVVLDVTGPFKCCWYNDRNTIHRPCRCRQWPTAVVWSKAVTRGVFWALKHPPKLFAIFFS